MIERTIEVHRVPPPNERAQRVYQIVTHRQRLDGQGQIDSVFTITEREAIELVNQLCHAIVAPTGGDDD